MFRFSRQRTESSSLSLVMESLLKQDLGMPQKDFQCPVCMKFFSRKFTLEMHLLIHQGLKPHTCPYCGKSFRQKGTLMRHKVRHEVSPNKMEWRKEHDSDGGGGHMLPSSAYSSTGDGFSPPRPDRNSLMISDGKDKNMVVVHHRPGGGEGPHGRGEFMPPPPLTGPGRQNSHSTSGGIMTSLPQLTMSPFAANAPPKSSLKWHCNVCLLEMPFDYTPCNSHLQTHEHQFQHKCFLCLKLYASNSEYSQHIEQFHSEGGKTTFAEEFISYTGPGQYSSNSTSFHSSPKYGGPSKESPDGKKTSSLPLSEKLNLPTVNSGELTIKPISSSDNPPTSSSQTSSHGTEKPQSQTTLTCIPCQVDFASEEDFECHVKTHVQSVLVVGSDSDGSYEGLRMHSSFNSRSHDSEMLSQSLNGSISIENKSGQPLVVDTRIPSLLSGGDMLIKQDGFRTNKVLSNYKENYPHRRSYSSFAREHFSSKRPRNQNLAYFEPPPPKRITNNFVTSDSLLKLEKLKQNISTKFGQQQQQQRPHQQSALKFQNNVSSSGAMTTIPGTELSVRIETAAPTTAPTSNPQPPTQVFLCPFCKKYFSTAKILCRHAKLHLLEEKPKHLDIKKDAPGDHAASITKKLPPEVEIIKVGSEDVNDNTTQHPQEEANLDAKSEGEITDDEEEVYETKPSVESIYDYDAPLVCEDCNLEFRKKCLYAYHLQLHMKVKAYSCWICRKHFSKKHLLLRHTRSRHMKTFSCPNCARGFQYKTLFKYHLSHCETPSSDFGFNSDSFCVPIIDLKQLGCLTTPGNSIIGVIPIGTGKQAIGIPVVSPSQFSILNTLPLMGRIPIFGKMERSS